MAEPKRAEQQSGPDLVLIDDEALVRDLWQFEADARGLRLLALEVAEELDDFEIDFATPVYVDLHLGQGTSGIDVAKKLEAQGFRRISLTTGQYPGGFDCPAFITAIIGKGFPINHNAASGCEKEGVRK